ncbi:uncharacterized protein F5Z01DRAFT_754429 [Emericellopsis atlantica]|uniref:Uncharacterized protein n=1 Tax=Emericellopsis atlantica TaxID=2614577 RepID=A0A9P7ZDK4_9HYPO|nr:uncharacterized protein F5Z01DRAFT_754429 [Emericellopsis atlantica]KAG9249498.1 hypothetical protein F5Z01DRAFT_754429 [Emericellopsis atlantica]
MDLLCAPFGVVRIQPAWPSSGSNSSSLSKSHDSNCIGSGLILVAASDFALSETAFLDYNHGDTDSLDPDDPNDRARRNTIMLAHNVYSRTASVGSLFRRIAQVLLTMTIIETANGLLFALKRQRTTSQKVLRWLTMSLGFVFVVLALAHTVMANTIMREQWYDIFNYHATSTGLTGQDDFSYLQSLVSRGAASRCLDGAYNVLNFIVAIGVLVYTSVVMHYYAQVEPSRVLLIWPANTRRRQCAIDLLFAALLNFSRWMWLLVVSALWILPDRPVIPSTNGTSYGGNAFLDIIDFAIIVIILFSISVLKKKGLWTTLQPWMGGVPPVMVVRQYPAYGQLQVPGQVGYYPNGYLGPQQAYVPSGQQQQVQYVYYQPQEVGGGARYEMPPDGINELGGGMQREKTADMKVSG